MELALNNYQLGRELALKQMLMHTNPSQMGSLFSDVTRINIDLSPNVLVEQIFKSVGEVINFIGQTVHEGLKHVSSEINKLLSQINWEHIGSELGKIARGAGHIFLVELNPLHLVWQGLSTFPLTEHMARELDKLTGGAISTIEDIPTITGRFLIILY